MTDPRVITDMPLPDTNTADITVSFDLVNSSPEVKSVEVSGKIENISFSRQIELQGGEKKKITFSPADFAQLHISNSHDFGGRMAMANPNCMNSC